MTKKPGVGYPPPKFAQWEIPRASFPLDPSAHPWGSSGGQYQGSPDEISVADRDLLVKRYGVIPSGNRPIGCWNELQGLNFVALKVWFQQQPEAHRSRYSGVPSTEEVYDAAVSHGRRAGSDGGFYAAAYRTLEGGAPEAAFVIHEKTYSRYAWMFESGDLDPKLGMQSSPNSLGYPFYYDIQWLPNSEAPVDSPPPPPDPEPEPDPPAKRYSTPEVRAEELWEMVESVFKGARALGFPPPPWLVAMRQSAKPFALPLLPDAVRAKRKLLGQPEEGS